MFVGFIVTGIKEARKLKEKLSELITDKEPEIFVLFNGWDETDIKYYFSKLSKKHYSPEEFDDFLEKLNYKWLKFSGDSIEEFIVNYTEHDNDDKYEDEDIEE